MTQELLNAALPRLRRSLGVGTEEDEILADRLCAAEEEILRYLNRTELPEYARSLLIELAGLKYLQSGAGKKSESYSEGQISQSESFYSPAELREGTERLLAALAPYRRVGCKGAEQ